jgi:chromosome partitioning protein
MAEAVRIIVANNKGGIGKTVTCLNVAAFLAQRGKRVLVIDLDPQSNLTISFGINIGDCKKSVSEIMLSSCTPKEAVIKVMENIDVIPARPDLSKTVTAEPLASHKRKNEILKFMMEALFEEYDYILMDTAPAIDSVLTTNGFAMADYVLVPMQFELYATVGLRHVQNAIDEIKAQWINRDLKLLGIIGTFYQNTRNCRHFHEIVKESGFGSLLFETMIRRNVALSASVCEGMPITRFDRNSNGYNDYEKLTDEICKRVAS